MELTRHTDRLLRRLRRRIMLAIGRGVVRLVDDTLRTQALQVEGYAGELLDGVEHLLPYGLATHPRPESLALLLAVGGMRQHTIAAAVTDPDARPRNLAEGEVCLYTHLDETDDPHRIILGADRSITLKCGRSSITMTDTDILLDSPHVGLNDP